MAIRTEMYARKAGQLRSPCILATAPLPGTSEASEDDILNLFADNPEYAPDSFVKLTRLKLFKELMDDLYNQTFVHLEEGKALSANDFTDILKEKLEGIEGGAQVNVIESIMLDGVLQNITGKQVTLNLGEYAKKSEIASGINYRGSVALYEDLPQNPAHGDMYNVRKADAAHGINPGDNVIWTGTEWDVMRGDLDNYVMKEEGKGLSANDFTDADKEEVETLSEAATWTIDNVQAIFDGLVYSSTVTVPAPSIPYDGEEDATTEDIENLFFNSSADGEEDATTEDIESLFG